MKRGRLAAIILLALNFLVLARGIFALDAEVTDARYQVTPALPAVPGLPGSGTGGQVFLAASISIDLPARFIGQKITFKEVVFLTKQEKEVGRLAVSAESAAKPNQGSVQVQRRLRVAIQGPGGRTTQQETPEPVLGALRLYPFEDASIYVQVLARSTLGVNPGDELIIRVVGRSGLRKWTAEGPLKAPGPAPANSQPSP